MLVGIALLLLWLAIIAGRVVFQIKAYIPHEYLPFVIIGDVIFCVTDFIAGVAAVVELNLQPIWLSIPSILFAVWVFLIAIGFIGLLMLSEPPPEREVVRPPLRWLRRR